MALNCSSDSGLGGIDPIESRLDVNRLFMARSGHQFRLQLTGGQLRSRVKDHAREQLHEQPVPRRSVIGVGSGANYTLYNPASDHIQFCSAMDLSKQSTPGSR
ncbi:MAG: hypothetical protein CMK50_01650 [Propionibacteriaceae bacterium]|nr:hypothetical protein [Propionibacteriaceae bacterium]